MQPLYHSASSKTIFRLHRNKSAATFYTTVQHNKSAENLFAISRHPFVQKTQSTPVVARLYKDAIRRMGQFERVEKEKSKDSYIHSRTRSADLFCGNTSAYASASKSQKRLPFLLESSKTVASKSFLRPATSFGHHQSPKPATTIKPTKETLQKLLKTAETKSALAITKNSVECLEKVYQMRPTKQNAALLASALKHAKTPVKVRGGGNGTTTTITKPKIGVKQHKSCKATQVKGQAELDTDI